jgi:hypothetical protein
LLTFWGILEFRFLFPNRPDWDNECHVFTVDYFAEFGEITETEEMAPQWFKLDEIPFDQMWSDDAIWLNRVVREKEQIHYRFWHNSKTSQIVRYDAVK